MPADTSSIVDHCQQLAVDFHRLSSELLDERFTALLESCTTIEHSTGPDELELALESALITVEEQADFFGEMIAELQLELLRREELVIESFWRLAEENESAAVEQPAELPPPPPVPAVADPPVAGDAGSESLTDLITESRKFLDRAGREGFPLEAIEDQLNKVVARIDTATRDWYRLNASATNQRDRKSAAAFKRNIDQLTHSAKRLESLGRRSGASASAAAQKKPPVPQRGQRVTTPAPPRARSVTAPAPPRARSLTTPASPRARSVTTPAPPRARSVAAPRPRPQEPAPAPVRSRRRSFSAEYCAELEEDFYTCRGLWNDLFNTAQGPEERDQLLWLKDLLTWRWKDINRWRQAQSFQDEDPEPLNKVFAQFRPATPHVTTEAAVPASTSLKMQEILRDLKNNPGYSRQEKGTHAPNRKVFRTAGRINPRANR